MTLGMFNFILDGATIAVGFWFVIKIFLAVMSRNSFMVTAKRHKYKSTRLQVIGMWKSRHIRFCGMLVIAMVVLYMFRYYLHNIWLALFGWFLIILAVYLHFYLEKKILFLEEQNEAFWDKQKMPASDQR